MIPFLGVAVRAAPAVRNDVKPGREHPFGQGMDASGSSDTESAPAGQRLAPEAEPIDRIRHDRTRAEADGTRVDQLPGRVPPKALVLSSLALGAAAAASLLFPDEMAEYSALVWLLAIVPAFLFAYYKGWQGAAVILVAAMGLLRPSRWASTCFGTRRWRGGSSVR